MTNGSKASRFCGDNTGDEVVARFAKDVVVHTNLLTNRPSE